MLLQHKGSSSVDLDTDKLTFLTLPLRDFYEKMYIQCFVH